MFRLVLSNRRSLGIRSERSTEATTTSAGAFVWSPHRGRPLYPQKRTSEMAQITFGVAAPDSFALFTAIRRASSLSNVAAGRPPMAACPPRFSQERPPSEVRWRD
jgi:hypothetical protein